MAALAWTGFTLAHLASRAAAPASANTLGLGAPYEPLLTFQLRAAFVILCGTSLTVAGSFLHQVLLYLLRLCTRVKDHQTREFSALTLPTSVAGLAVLLLPTIVMVIVQAGLLPHQAVFCILFAVQMRTTSMAQVTAQVRPPSHGIQIYLKQCLFTSEALLWCTVLKAPTLVIWARNVIHGWPTENRRGPLPLALSDMRVVETLPLLFMCQIMASRQFFAPISWHQRLHRALKVALICLAILLPVYGARRPYVMLDIIKGTIAAAIGTYLASIVDRGRTMTARGRHEGASLIQLHDISDAPAKRLPIEFQHSEETAASAESRDSVSKALLDATDRYLNRRSSANETLRSAFLNLGKAKVQSQHWIGTRVGKDGWDLRARSGHRCEVTRQGLLRLEGPARSDASEEKEPQSPLHQFAALPSSALRRAHAEFERALVELMQVSQASREVDKAVAALTEM